MLLIITNRSDLACDYLILKLKARQIPFLRLNTDLYPDSISFDIAFENSKPNSIIRLENGDELRLNSISAVYFRQPISPNVEYAQNSIENEFAQTELTEMLRSLWRIIPERLWLNHPRQLWLASNKVDQLLAAISVGFAVPDTLISYSIESIRSFILKKKSNVISKAVRHGFIRAEEKVLLAGTQRLPENYIKEFSNFAPVPMNYQEEIEKGSDLRVVVVDNHVFPTSIKSDNCEDIDWRIVDLKGGQLIHERAELPKTIEQKCLSIVKHFGLNYSSIDLVQSCQGEYFFLELNPNGQWAWIEQLTGYPIRDTIIDFLIRK